MGTNEDGRSRAGAGSEGDAVPFAWVLVDPAGHLVGASTGALEFLCVERGSALGSRFSRFVVPDDRHLLESALFRARTTGSAQLPIRMRPKGRSPRARRLVMRPAEQGNLHVSMIERPISGRSAAAPAAAPPAPSPDARCARVEEILTTELPNLVDASSGWSSLVGTPLLPEVRARALAAIQRHNVHQRELLEELTTSVHNLVDELRSIMEQSRALRAESRAQRAAAADVHASGPDGDASPVAIEPPCDGDPSAPLELVCESERTERSEESAVDAQ